MTNTKRQELVVHDSLPADVALKIASFLEVSDVCSLGCCSKFWREICDSDYLWKSLCKERWPGLVLEEKEADQTSDYDHEKASTLKGWRGLYMKKHTEVVESAAYLKKSLSCQAIDVNGYLKAIDDMESMQFGFKDVRIILLKPNINVLLNLVGLHYCLKRLGVQVGSIVEALSSCKIQDRRVLIQWWTNGGYLHRFRLPDEMHDRSISLKDLTGADGEEIFGVLEHGITREMRRVQISASKCK